MVKTYKVLWLDDEFDELDLFSNLAKANDIILEGFKSFEEGFNNFDSKVFYYDAIVLDALFFKTNTQVSGSEDLKGLSAAKDKIAEFRKQRKIPYFILSGQTKLERDGTFFESYGQHYRKQNQDDIVRLFADIKAEADKEPYTRLRQKFQNVYDVCTEKYIGEIVSKHLNDVLYSIEYPVDKFDDEKYFNGIRKVVEYVFRASNKLGLLHDKCIPNGIVNLTWSSLFLAGKELELKPTSLKIGCSKIYFSSILANNIRTLLDITNAASHTEGEEWENAKLNFSEYKNQIKSNYLLYSLTFQVMDLILWFKKCADENSDPELNKTHWVNENRFLGEWINGEVFQLNEQGGFAFFKPVKGNNNSFIPASLVSTNNLSEKNPISVIIEEYKDKNNETKTRVKQLKKI